MNDWTLEWQVLGFRWWSRGDERCLVFRLFGVLIFTLDIWRERK